LTLNSRVIRTQAGALAVTWADIKISGKFWAYRLSAYLLLNFVDDPAWLALMFC